MTTPPHETTLRVRRQHAGNGNATLRYQPKYLGEIERGGLAPSIAAVAAGLARIVHHRLPVSEGGTNAPSNMETLCFACHRFEHSLF